METDNIKSFLKKSNTIAVVGASNNPEKYGYRVYKDLISAGYHAIPINFKDDTIQGDDAFHYLKDYPGKIDVVNLVVKPEVSIEILKQALAMQIKNIWFQPGSESEEVLEFAQDNGFNIISGQCIMVERLKLHQ